MNQILPKTYLIGYTSIDEQGLQSYLVDTNQTDFYDSYLEAKEKGLSTGEILCSFYAKLCYRSLVLGKNQNISRIRDIEDNIKGCFNTGHGSVFEHCWLNFVTTNCSRVFTHELVRHRVGTAFSQTSGRYVSIDQLDLVVPPELSDEKSIGMISQLKGYIEVVARDLRKHLIDDKNIKDFATKKKITSAIRRIAPNGQTNEIGWSCNIRSLRHMIEMRTSRHAEWEIRLIFNQVADIIKSKWPLILYNTTIDEIEGLNEYCNLKI